MNSKQIALKALNLEPTPRPCAGVIAGGEWFFTQAGASFGEVKTDAKAMARVFINAYETLKPDLIWTGGGLLNYPAHCLGAPIEDAGSASPALSGPAINGLGELDKLDLKSAVDVPINQAIIESVWHTAQAMGQKAALFHTVWGPFTTAARVLGTESLMMATVTDPEGVSRLISFCTDYLWAICQEVMKHEDVLGINLSEPVASCDMISPATFQKFVVPALVDLIQRSKQAGKLITLHICGNSTPLLDEVVQLSPHGFSMENKVDLSAAREKLAGKVCALGNVSPTGNLLSGTPDEVQAESLNCLASWGESPGYILCNGCDFPKEAPLDNLLAMLSVRERQSFK
jgi:uroporphyrinogen decarboxylase